MRAHIIENGIVTNTIEVERLDFLPNLVEATEGSIGWLYDEATRVLKKPIVPFDYNKAWEDIKAERDNRTHNGGYPAAGKWFHSDTFSRSQQLGLVMMGVNIPAGLMWKTMDGSFIEMTQAVASDVFIGAGIQDSATFAHAESLKAQVEAASDPLSIDIYSGWPICFLDIE